MGRSLLQDQFDEEVGMGVPAIKAAQQGPLIRKLESMGLSRNEAIKAVASEGALGGAMGDPDPDRTQQTRREETRDRTEVSAAVRTKVADALGNLDELIELPDPRGQLANFLRELASFADRTGRVEMRDQLTAAAAELEGVKPPPDPLAADFRDGQGAAKAAADDRDAWGRRVTKAAADDRDGWGRRRG